ncbi:hypothetical protein ACHAXR_011803 [Thalassiosira sp. AJA248-18]
MNALAVSGAADAAASGADSSLVDNSEMTLDSSDGHINNMDVVMQKKDDQYGDRKKPPLPPPPASAAVASKKTPPPPPPALQSNNNSINHNDDLLTTARRNNTSPSPQWTSFLQFTPRCAGAEGIRDSSVFFKRHSSATAGVGASPSFDTAVPKCLKRLFKELDGLKDSLPCDSNCSIWLRFDEETPQYIRALLTAPLPGPTPYSGGLFTFDIYIPNDYPHSNPKVQLLTTGEGRLRFGPNLYADGKVCLSLLGTWAGPKWNPKHSSLYQVLISIQGLILGVEHPYYLEPGHGGWEGKVKEGDFQLTGRTLSGHEVKQEVGVPLQVILYEDVLRVGTVRYAMSQPLRWSMTEGGRGDSTTSMMSGNIKNGMEAFGDIIQAHFYENKTAILAEVRNWMSDSALGRSRSKALSSSISRRGVAGGGVGGGALQIDALKDLLPKLEELLSKAVMPQCSSISPVACAPAAITASNDDVMMDVEEDCKPPARQPVTSTKELVKAQHPINDSAAKQNTTTTTSTGNDVVEQKRRQMQEAAAKGDFILAGKLQKEVQRLEELQRGMQEAAQQGDFIRAGRLQSQFMALTVNASTVAATAAAPSGESANQQQLTSTWNNNDTNIDTNDDWSDVEDDEDIGDEDMDWNDEDGMDEDEGFGPIGQFHHGGQQLHHHGLGSNVFAPTGYSGNAMYRKHSWGTGHTLSAAPVAAAEQAASLTAAPVKCTTAAKAVVPQKKSILSDQLCRLKIRLPHVDKSVIEDFDKRDSLAEVYHRLESLVPTKDDKRKRSSSTTTMAAGPTVPGGAFSQPFSSAGFTLLLTRPKREFSLEMHGTKSLMELNLAPSATLTVMKCNERGVMYRGEVESRLRAAQGDACDVEGLTYEALMELTERVGKAGPKDGAAFLTLTMEEFEAHTVKISPSTYLESLGKSMTEVEDHDVEEDVDCRCPICLGSYDNSDNTPSLRKVKNCGHTMHTGCLQTWLRTNSLCPLCKVHIMMVPRAITKIEAGLGFQKKY